MRQLCNCGEQRLPTSLGGSRGFQGERASLAGARVLAMPHLHKRNPDASRHGLPYKGRGNLTWLPAYMTSSGGGGAGPCELGPPPGGGGGSDPTSADLRTRLPEFGHASTPLLRQAGSLASQFPFSFYKGEIPLCISL